MKKHLIGHVAVDSGQLILVDPCYLREWKDGNVEFKDSEVTNAKANHYAAACAQTVKGAGGELLVAGIAGTGVAFPTGWGDGNYPVHALVSDEGRVVKVEVDFSDGEEIFE